MKSSNDNGSDSPVRVQVRSDLEQSRQNQGGRTYLVVKDPLTHRYFRFTEAQAALVELLTAPLAAEELAQAASEKLGSTVSAETAAAFMDSLEKKQLLDTPKVRDALANLKGQKLQKERNLLYWKLASIDPERIFNWLLPRTKWAFHPGFHVAALLVILCGAFISYTYWSRLVMSAGGLFSLYGFFLVWPVMFLVITIHEFAHGLTCRHFGGKVHEVGFMLIYFQPAFYCDVSDSWMFASKRERMWVTLAGGYVQFVVWGLCTILWRVTDSAAFINEVALVVVMFSGAQSLINFNPLIKLDGYYMLSDYLEIPNLRQKAMEALWGAVSGKKRPDGTAREVRAKLLYGTAAVLFSTTLLVYIYGALYTWATSTYAFAGLVAFLMFSTVTLRKTASESIAGVRAVASRVAMKRLRNAGIVAAALLASFVVEMELKIPARFRILPQSEQNVRSLTEGTIAEVRVREGDRVHNGEVLAILHDFEKDRKLKETMGELEEARHLLDSLQAPIRQVEIDRYTSQIETKETELANIERNKEQRIQYEEKLARLRTELREKQLDLDRSRELAKGGLTARVVLDKAEADFESKTHEVSETEAALRGISETAERDRLQKTKEIAQVRADLKVLLAGNPLAKQMEQQAKVEKLQGQVKLLQAELERTAIKSPIDGMVVTRFMEQKQGERLKVGDPFCRIVDTRRVIVEMKVPEKEIADVHPGNLVTMKVGSFPNKSFQGRVDRISKIVEANSTEEAIFKVESDLVNDDLLLAPDMGGSAKIYGGQQKVISLLTRRLHRWVNVDLWDLLPF